MAVLNNVPPPTGDPIAQTRRPQFKDQRDPKEGLITEAWENYFGHQTALSEKFSARVANVSLTNQSTSIGATDMTDGTLSAGLYRLTYYFRITTVDSIGSDVQLVIDWQDGSQTLVFTGATVITNTLSSYQTGSLPLIRVDALAPVRYSTNVVMASGDGRHSLYIVLDEVLA